MLDPGCKGRTRKNENHSWNLRVAAAYRAFCSLGAKSLRVPCFKPVALRMLLINAGEGSPNLSLGDDNFQK